MTYPATRAVARKAGRNRIVVGGVDVTYFRDKATPFPRYSLTEPFAYGSTSLEFPQVHAGYERTGVGDLAWAKQGARVQLSRVWDDGTEVIDYVGEVASIDPTGRALRMDAGGQFSGPASILQEVVQMFRTEQDVGHWAAKTCGRVGLSFDPWFGPVTGIDIEHTGGQTLLSWAQNVCAMSQDNGEQRVIMPTAWGSDTWHFPVKDRTTVHATAFHDDARVVLSVTDDVTEQPNVIYGTCVTPEGVRVTNAKWPNVFSGPAPDYPKADGTAITVGFTNADSVNGDGVDILYDKLRNLGYLPWEIQNTGTYTTDFATAVKKFQRKAGLSQTGNMTATGWKALYNTAKVGYRINGAYREPLAEDDRVREWDRAENGAILNRNPLFDPSVPRVEVDYDYGPGMRKGAMFRHAQGVLTRSQSAKNWTGTLRFNNAGLFVGDVAATRATLTDANLMPMRDLRPGMNVWVPDFDGGTLFHVSGCDVDDTGVTATVDTQARDLIEVSAINARDVESRRNIRREWNQSNIPAKHSHALISSDENFGILDRDVHLVANEWNVIPMIVGQHGQINRVDLRMVNDKPEFATMILTKPMTVGGKPGISARLKRRIPNPLAISDQSWLEDNDVTDWLDDRVILYAAGDGKQPCGYYPRRKKNDAGNATGAPITGRHLDDQNFAYICAPHTQVIVFLAIFPDRDCTLKRGQRLYCQLDSSG